MSDDWDTDKEFFIQWKGTDVCMDLHCPACKYHNHYDGFFAYFVQCGQCRAIYELPCLIPFKRVESVPDNSCQPLQDSDYDPDEEAHPSSPTELCGQDLGNGRTCAGPKDHAPGIHRWYQG